MGCKSCDTPKPKHRKGLWSPEEDQRLRSYMLKHGLGCWSAVPGKTGLQRNGKSCRLRWINYLRPGLKRGVFTVKEEETILTLHELLGNKWSQIATHLPGRTDNEIKNYWNSYLKKKTIKLGFEPETSTATVASQPSQTPNVQISKFEFPVPTESNQTSPTNSNILDSYAGAENQKGPPPPKLFLFTEWLTSHCGASWSFADSDESTFPDGNSISSSTEELFKQEIFNFEGPMVGPVYQPGSGYGELQPEFMPESGFPAGGFYDLFSVGDFSSDFTMNQKM